MDQATVERLREIAEELYTLVKRPDIYTLIIVDTDSPEAGNTRAMSNLTENDMSRFLQEVAMNVMKTEGSA